MRPLARWPVMGVILVCIMWVLLCVLVPVLWVNLQLRSEMARMSGGGGVASVTMGVDTLVVVVPPVVFCLAWFLARWRSRPSARSGAG